MLTAFTDVPKNHWAYNFVNKAQELGIVSGVTPKLFNPDATISKQEVAYLLINVLTRTNPIENEAFEESASGSAIVLNQAQIADWAGGKLAYGFENGFWKLTDFQAPVNGVSGGSSVLTRQMMARWIVNTMGYKTFGLHTIPFNDKADIDPAYYAYVDSLYRYSIMEGGDGMFNPNLGMDRAQAAGVAVKIYNENTAANKKIELNPFAFETGSPEEMNAKNRSFLMNGKLLQIAEDAVILLDGNPVNFSEIEKLAGKNLSISLYLAGENTKTVLVQTKPFVKTAVIDELVKMNTPGIKEYTKVTLSIDGIKADYVINSDSEVLSSLGIGNTVQYISDGIYILEIK